MPGVFSDEIIDGFSVYDGTAKARAFLSEKALREARVRSLAELLCGALIAKSLREDPGETEWDLASAQSPLLAGDAWMAADERYELWSTEQWPESLQEVADGYSKVVILSALETDSRMASKIAELEKEVAAIEPVNLTPPEGLPFRTDPKVVQDPEKRAEYEARLEKERHNKELEYRLHNALNVQAFYRRAMEYNISSLIGGLEPAAQRALIAETDTKTEVKSPLWELAKERLKWDTEKLKSP